MAYLNKGLEITFIDEREKDPEKQKTVYMFEGGIADYVKYINRDKSPVYDHIIMLEGMQDDVRICLAIQHTDDYSESIFSYVNNIPTAEGGTHEQKRLKNVIVTIATIHSRFLAQISLETI